MCLHSYRLPHLFLGTNGQVIFPLIIFAQVSEASAQKHHHRLWKQNQLTLTDTWTSQRMEPIPGPDTSLQPAAQHRLLESACCQRVQVHLPCTGTKTNHRRVADIPSARWQCARPQTLAVNWTGAGSMPPTAWPKQQLAPSRDFAVLCRREAQIQASFRDRGSSSVFETGYAVQACVRPRTQHRVLLNARGRWLRDSEWIIDMEGLTTMGIGFLYSNIMHA